MRRSRASLIESYRLADSTVINDTLIKTKSDKDGRFRLLGMPLGAGNEVVLTPPEDQPYLLSQFKLPSASEMKPIHIDLVLKRGIWMRGRITDRVTGKPVQARLRYATSLNNPSHRRGARLPRHLLQRQRARQLLHEG